MVHVKCFCCVLMVVYSFGMNTLYKDLLLEHYRNPRNKGTLEGANFKAGDYNPSCGDGISMEGLIEGGVIKKIMFSGVGCVISQATASILTEAVVGKTIKEVLALSTDDIQQLIGIQLGILRLKCALLPLQVLQQGVKAYHISHIP